MCVYIYGSVRLIVEPFWHSSKFIYGGKKNSVPAPSKAKPGGPSGLQPPAGQAPASLAPIRPPARSSRPRPALAARASGSAQLAVSGWPQPAGSGWLGGGPPFGVGFDLNLGILRGGQNIAFSLYLLYVLLMGQGPLRRKKKLS